MHIIYISEMKQKYMNIVKWLSYFLCLSYQENLKEKLTSIRIKYNAMRRLKAANFVLRTCLDCSPIRK